MVPGSANEIKDALAASRRPQGAGGEVERLATTVEKAAVEKPASAWRGGR
jgi:hypothetical protein